MAKDADSDYNSEEDSDFHDDDAISHSSSDESEPGTSKKTRQKELDEGDLVTIAAKEKSENEEDSGDLVLTRAQKRRK